MPEHQQELTELVRGEKDDISKRIVEEELRPVVREAITEEVLRGIQDLVGLTPEAVLAIGEDLRSEDSTIRQRAYGLILKYTLGNAAVAPTDDNTGKELVVNIGIPRPDVPENPGIPQPAESTPDAEQVTELKTCDMCARELEVSYFVDGSERCQDCWAEQRRRVAEKYPDA